MGPPAHILDQAVKSKRHLHSLEVYAGAARTTKTVVSKGGLALCLGLLHGQDFNQARDRAFLEALLHRFKPWHVWLAFPCTAFCQWSRLNAARGCNLSSRKSEGLFHLEFSLDIAELAHSLGCYVTLENPLGSTAWLHKRALHLFLRTAGTPPVCTNAGLA